MSPAWQGRVFTIFAEYLLSQGFTNLSLWAASAPLFLSGFIGMLPHLFIYFYDCHHAPKVELSVCGKHCIASKASNIDYLALYEKSFSASFLSHCIY